MGKNLNNQCYTVGKGNRSERGKSVYGHSSARKKRKEHRQGVCAGHFSVRITDILTLHRQD